VSGVIVNADDLGLSEPVNAGIFEAIDAGAVGDVSVLANGGAFADAVDGLRRRNIAAVGVHFCVVDVERPLAPPDACAALLAGDRFLDRNALFARMPLQARRIRRAVAAELAAQVERVERAGFTVSHLDSHQHVHLFPGIAEEVVAFCRARRVPFLRAPVTTSGTPVRAVVAVLSARLRALARRAGVRTVPSFGFEHSGRLTSDRLARYVRRAREAGLAEVMTHPGAGSSRSDPRYAHWGYDWDRELHAVVDGVGRAGIGPTLSFAAALAMRDR
jgi:predicted glycoside hydrolase/deacetylase ChbG (UPF0249 family)